LINIFFVGQSEFNEMLMMDQNRALRQRISVRYNLEPLNEKETVEYIRHRLKIANVTREIFRPKAFKKIFKLSNGYPRLVNILCDRCLLTGYSMGLQYINYSIVEECAQELKIAVNKSETRIKEQTFSKNKKIQDSNKTLKYRFGKIRAVAIAIIFLAWCVAGYSFYKSKNANETLSNHLSNYIKKKISIFNEEKDIYTQGHLESEVKKAGQNTSVRNEKRDQIEHFKKPIYFNHNSNELNSESTKILDKLSKLVLRYPESNLIIEGHSDSAGDYRYNKRLSEIRAKSVKAYFVEKGISSEKIKTVGMGSEYPIASNETFVGKEKNRRVEIIIYLN
jgi:general secretion pathway protein A